MKKNIKLLAIAIAVVIVAYFGYDLLKPYLYPCESIFQQTATQIGGNVETIQAKGGLFIGARKIQELTERSQMVALNLKTCCTLSDKAILSSQEFLECKGSAETYQEKLTSIVNDIEEVEEAEERGNEEVVSEKRQQINNTIDELETESAEIRKKALVTETGETVDNQNRTANPNQSAESKTINEYDSEPNNTILESQATGTRTAITAEISDDDNADYYSFQYKGNLRDMLEIQFSNGSAGLAPRISIFDENKSQIQSEFNRTKGGDVSTRFIAEPGNTYYVAVTPISRKAGSHSYKLTISGPLEMYDEYEMNDDAFNAIPIQTGETIQANLLDTRDTDWYRIDNIPAEMIRITLENRSTNLSPQIVIYNENKSDIKTNQNATSGGNLDFSLETEAGKTYYFAVQRYGGKVNVSGYNFTVFGADE